MTIPPPSIAPKLARHKAALLPPGPGALDQRTARLRSGPYRPLPWCCLPESMPALRRAPSGTPPSPVADAAPTPVPAVYAPRPDTAQYLRSPVHLHSATDPRIPPADCCRSSSARTGCSAVSPELRIAVLRSLEGPALIPRTSAVPERWPCASLRS